MWLRIDERTDVIASLALCLSCLQRVTSQSVQWKWAILSLHSALQSAMVCHLSGTAQLGAMSSKCVTEWLDWRERDNRGEIKRISTGVDEYGLPGFRFATEKDHPPRERLADAKELFIRLHNSSKRCELGSGSILSISNAQRDSFRRLHNLRNDFAHFTPKGWAIELSGLPQIFRDILEVVELISNDPWPFRHMKRIERWKLRRLIEEIKATTEAIETAK